MLFNSFKYGLFLVAVFVVYWSLVRVRAARILFLLAASYFFYANWNPTFLLLIWFSSSLDFFLGGLMPLARAPWRKKALLVISLTANLGLLVVFKYADFFLGSVSDFCLLLGLDPIRLRLDLILPVGISFYTFQTLTYIIEIYRGKLAPTYDYFHYLTFVSMFPQLTAGPIARAADMLPQIENPSRLTDGQGSRALWLIMGGLFKKVVIADALALGLVDRVFAIPEMYTSWEALAAIYGYALQIYCDFSGYTDVAIGSALLLGFRLPSNFNAPYLASNPRDFWRRWHISLSFWFRDYLYIPLGGSRKGIGRAYVNLWITMLLCGLWHGAEWKFIFWGFIHALGQMITRMIQRRTGRENPRSAWARLVVGILTFHFVCFGWVFFRADDVAMGFNLLGTLFSFIGSAPNLTWQIMLWLFLGFAMHLAPQRHENWLQERFAALPASVQGLVLFGVIIVLYSVASSDVRPYIYYQF